MKKLIAIIVLLVAAGGGTYWYVNYGKPKEKPQVLTATVARGSIVEAVIATGTLESTRLVNVGSQVSGTVDDLYKVDYNSIVHQGQKIAHIDDKLFQVQVDIAQANLERQQGDLDQMRVQLDNDKLNYERTKALFDKGLANKQALEQADLQVKSRVASITSSEKQMKQTQASLDQAKLNVSYCTIVAPVDGVIVERKVDIGQAVQSSVNVAQFYTIATDLTQLKLTASVDESEIGKVRRGMPVQFTVESYGPQNFTGTVDAVRLNATTQNNVVTYPVWITVPNADLKLRPSMTASLKIIISTAEDAVRIPNGALRFKPNAEIYTALGLTPPGPGQGGRVGGQNAGGPGNGRPGGGQGANAQPGAGPAPGTPGAPSAPASPDATAQAPQPQQMAENNPQDQQQQRQGGRGGRGGGNRNNRGFGGGGGGFGQGQTIDPQAMANFMKGRGQGAGGRGNGRNQTAANAAGDTTPLTERKNDAGQKAEKIDELFQETPRKLDSGTVWTWDEAKKELKSIRVTTGVTDGTFTELVSGGDIQAGQQLVTNVIIPISAKPAAGGANPFMGQQPGRGMGGMTPGGNPGGGGGGGGRGGGGGGGRGGN